jgi:protein TonB
MKAFLTVISLVIAFSIKAQTTNKTTGKRIVFANEQYPKFPGGNKAWSQFLTKNLRFPPDDGTDYAVTVFVSFIVEKDGRLSHIKTLKSICSKCDDETLRAIKLSPNWLPAKLHGKTIRSKYTVPIRFDLYDTI